MPDPISLDQFRKKKEKAEKNKSLSGTMVWLSCPKCKKIEYTEIVAPNGRQHSCGTQVDEVEVQLDLRAEATIAIHNLNRLKDLISRQGKGPIRWIVNKALEKALQGLLLSEETFLSRLQSASLEKLEPYEGTDDELKEILPIKEINDLELWISEFRYKPEQRFER